MLAAYGVDVLAPTTTLRRVHVLLDRLPGGSWPDEHASLSWSTEAHLLAGVVDALAGLTYVTVKAHSSAGRSVAMPKPMKRPTGYATLAAGRGPGGSSGPGRGGHKAGGWAEFARALARQPGVVTDG